MSDISRKKHPHLRLQQTEVADAGVEGEKIGVEVEAEATLQVAVPRRHARLPSR